MFPLDNNLLYKVSSASPSQPNKRTFEFSFKFNSFLTSISLHRPTKLEIPEGIDKLFFRSIKFF